MLHSFADQPRNTLKKEADGLCSKIEILRFLSVGILSCPVKKNVLSMKIMRLTNGEYSAKIWIVKTIFKNINYIENKLNRLFPRKRYCMFKLSYIYVAFRAVNARIHLFLSSFLGNWNRYFANITGLIL